MQTQPMQTRAVIFDCDGTLVDSEPLSALVFAEALAAEGLSITPAEALAAFRGRRMALCIDHAAGLLGRPLPVDVSSRLLSLALRGVAIVA